MTGRPRFGRAGHSTSRYALCYKWASTLCCQSQVATYKTSPAANGSRKSISQSIYLPIYLSIAAILQIKSGGLTNSTMSFKSCRKHIKSKNIINNCKATKRGLHIQEFQVNKRREIVKFKLLKFTIKSATTNEHQFPTQKQPPTILTSN